MFQLNRKKIIIGIIIWFLCIAFTVLLVFLSNVKKATKNEGKEIKEENTVAGGDLYGTFDQNDLIINEVNMNDSISYPSISGLKDKVIENKINAEIYSKVIEAQNSGYKRIHYNVLANFSNILSISIHLVPEDYNEYNTEYLSYDLTTGNKIKLEDLFTDESSMYNILASAFHDSISMSKSYENNESAYATVEDDVFRIIQKIKKDKNSYRLSISNDVIYVYVDENSAAINFSDYYNYLVYFDRFKTKNSIFESNDVGIKRIINVFPVGSSSNLKYYKFAYVDDYGLIDSAIIGGNLSNTSNVNFKKIIEDKIDSNKKAMNKNKFTIVNLGGQVFEHDKGIISIHTDTTICIMGKDLFNSKLKEEYYKNKKYSGNRGTFINFASFNNNSLVDCKFSYETIYLDSNGELTDDPYDNSNNYMDNIIEEDANTDFDLDLDSELQEDLVLEESN